MKKRLDQLSHDELEKVNEFIPFGNRPIKQARIMFPNITGTGSVKTVQNIKKYVWNKLLSEKKHNESERDLYIDVCVITWKEIPNYAREIDLELIK